MADAQQGRDEPELLTTATSTPSEEDSSSTSNSGDCNAVGISLLGDISTHPTDSITTETISENIYFSVKNAENDKNIRAIIIEIDSRLTRTENFELGVFFFHFPDFFQ